MGPLYRQCLDDAEAKRAAHLELRTGRRLARQQKFIASIDRPAWEKRGRRVVLRG